MCVHFQARASYGVIQHCCDGIIFVETAVLLCVPVYGLQENLVSHWSCDLRVWSLGLHLVLVDVVRLWNSLLLLQHGLLQPVGRTVERRNYMKTWM